MIYGIAVALFAAYTTFIFIQGYNYADNKAELEKANAKIVQLEIAERYLREGNNAAQSEASEATKSLEANLQVIDKLNNTIKKITENPTCVDENVLDLIRELK